MKIPKALKWALIVVGSALLLVILAAIGLVMYARSVTPPWPERLEGVRIEPTRPFLAEEDVTEDNAYFFLKQLNYAEGEDVPELVDFSDDWERFKDDGFWENASYPLMETGRVEYAEQLVLLEQAATLPNCQVATCIDPDIPMLYGIASVSPMKLHVYQAEKLGQNQNWTEATDKYKQVLKCASHIQRGGALIHYLIGLLGMDAAAESMQRIGEETRDIPPQFLKEAAQLLLETDRTREPFLEVMRYEAQFGLTYLDLAFTDGFIRLSGNVPDVAIAAYIKKTPLGWLGSSHEKTRAHFEAVYSHLIYRIQQPYDKKSADPLEAFLYDPHRRWSILADDPLGRVLLSILVPTMENVRIKDLGTASRLRTTAVTLALRAYALEHDGCFPDELQTLVPDYLDTVPADPFSREGEPLKYKVTAAGKWAVYSIGKNQVDDECEGTELGGRDAPDWVLFSDHAQRRREAAQKKESESRL